MVYRANLEECRRFGNGLILPSGIFIGEGEIEAYLGEKYLGNFDVKNVSKNLDGFLKNVREIREARKRDLGIGPIVSYGEKLEDIAKKKAIKYFRN
ncbi:MAG: hypothetical protein QXP77_03465 [Candidatus Aenigmatarchaeota archaeon]